MRILIVGGYGNFGGRLTSLLAGTAGIQLIVGGRSLEKAREFVDQLEHPEGIESVRFDRSGDLHNQLTNAQADVVIDASGPFQVYGFKPYALVEAAIDCGVHYLDLADSTDFVLNVSDYDDRAKKKGVFVLSGASTCPALSSAVARELASGMRRVNLVCGGIAPSPHAKVGRSVIDAIASYAGKPVSIVRRGTTVTAYPFTDTIKRRIFPPGRQPLRNLTFSLIDVPDLRLLPTEYPDAANIWFGAAPTPPVLHWLFRVIARAVRSHLVASATRFSGMIHIVVNLCEWVPDRGGMLVEVWGVDVDGSERIHSWHLTIDGEHGPLIPGLACKAIVKQCRRGQMPAAGARPANRELEMRDFDPLLTEIGARFGTRSEPADESGPLFQRVLRDAWSRLPPPIRNVHKVSGKRSFHGIASVTRGTSPLAAAVAWIVSFPPNGTRVSVDVSMSEQDGKETWHRNFSGHRFTSTLSYRPHDADWLLWEKFGPTSIGMALVIENKQLWYVPQEWKFLGIPLPKSLLPRGRMYESVEDDRFNFHVEVRLPLAGHIVTYEGWLE